jgi:hypothetical protein
VKKITLENYQKDKYYPRVVRAVQAILAKGGGVVAPVDVLVQMELLNKSDLEDWRFGRVPYLERVIHCNLEKASRILRILKMHMHDMKMRPSPTVYKKWGKGAKIALRFSKSGNPYLEEAYSLHFVAAWKSREQKAEAPTPPEEPLPVLDSSQSQDDDIPF